MRRLTADYRLAASVGLALIVSGLGSLTSGRISSHTVCYVATVPALIGVAFGIGVFAGWPAFIGWYRGIDPLDAEVES